MKSAKNVSHLAASPLQPAALRPGLLGTTSLFLMKIAMAGAAMAAQPLSAPQPASPPEPPPAPMSVGSGNPLLFTEINQIGGGRCAKDRCASLHVRTADFARHPDFTQFLTRSLLSMASVPGTPARTADVSALMAQFEKTATPQTSEYLQANVVRNQSDLVVVDLVHYVFSGGAHGDTTSQYVNWLPETNRVASLETMLLPGAMTRFEQALREQHQIWLKEQMNAINDLKSFEQTWPFKPSDNAALMPAGLTVTYGRYVLGPGFFGQPSLVIPYSKLTNILKPEFLKAGMN